MTAYVDCLKLSSVEDELLLRRSPEERRRRAAACRRVEDARRCLAAGVLLRRAAERMGYTGEILTQTNEYGKPKLVLADDFSFSLAHAGDWVVIGYGNSPIGIDVEPIAQRRDISALAARFFTAEEIDYLSAGDAEEIPLRFARIWTGKESYVKYLGCGFAKMPPCSFSVDAEAGSICRADGLTVTHFSPDPAHIVAVCGKWDALEREILLPDALEG